MKNRKWLRLLAYVTGGVNQELLLQIEYLTAENRILRNKLPAKLRLSDTERATLAAIGKLLGRKALKEIASIAKPDTILAWYRKLIANKFDGAGKRDYPGRPSISTDVEALVVRMARENRSWGYDRIAGALANLGSVVSDQTVGNILKRHGIAPAPKRSQTVFWKDFIASHMEVLAGTDFFTVEILTWRGLVTYYVLFFMKLGSRRVQIAGITRHPDEEWMQQSRTDSDAGILEPPPRLPLLASRPRYEILPLVPIHGRPRWRKAAHAPCEHAESERVCGAVGSFGAAGMLVQTYPL